MFFKVEASDAIICYYLLNNKINNQVLYIRKEDISLLLFLLDKLNINYLYLNTLHEFINNQYDYYLMLANKKYEIQKLINAFRSYHGR